MIPLAPLISALLYPLLLACVLCAVGCAVYRKGAR